MDWRMFNDNGEPTAMLFVYIALAMGVFVALAAAVRYSGLSPAVVGWAVSAAVLLLFVVGLAVGLMLLQDRARNR